MISTDEENEIIKHWKNEDRELPGVNAVYYADGTVTIMSCYKLVNGETGETEKITFSPQCDTNIASMGKYDSAYWTSADIYVETDYRGGKLYGGSGAYEGTGFLAYEDEQGEFVWAVFFEDSEPIEKITVQDESIIAWGEEEWKSQLKITINSNNLTEIHMEKIR